MRVGFSPKPTSGTAIASTATGGKVWPIFTRLRDSGRNSGPTGRVTKMPSPTASTVLASVATNTVRRCDRVERQQAALVVDRRRIVHGQRPRRRRRRAAAPRGRRRAEAAPPARRIEQSRAHAGCRPRARMPSTVTRRAASPDASATGSASRADQISRRAHRAGWSSAIAHRPPRRPAPTRLLHRGQRQQPEGPLRRARRAARRRSSAGWVSSSAGAAYCSRRAWSMTAIRSPRWNASSMSCVTRTMVVPKRRWIARRSSCALPRMTGSSAPNGSSISSSVGLGGQRPRHADALLLAARQLVRKLALRTPPDRAGTASSSSSTRASMRASGPAEQARHGGDVLRHRPVRKQPVALDDIADAAAQLVLRDRQRCPGRR